ncbi:MAG: KamA family radical SAM protein, partial [Myxococcota bacterium]|nr:KamA family radical SAM protein [Myxococcota bacterium]
MEELASGAESWRALMAKGARSVEALVDAGLVDKTAAERLAPIADRYELLVNRYYLSLIDPEDPDCPIRKQAIPALEELVVTPGELRDPIGDHAHAPTPILVHRYPDRALLFPTFRCPMFCRFCFRKVSLNEEKIKLREALPESLSYLRAHPEIKEVILSGGDPLLLSNERLNWLFSSIREAGVPRLRIHSRVPVTLPQRIDKGLVELLSTYQPLFLICHFNHPRELSAEADKALSILSQAGIPLLNQSALLRGVNADPRCLRVLSEELLQRGVIPYYLHHPDLTPGTQ